MAFDCMTELINRFIIRKPSLAPLPFCYRKIETRPTHAGARCNASDDLTPARVEATVTLY
jgi:hypothetical protein